MIENTPLSYSQLENFHSNVIGFFTDKWESGDRNERFKRGVNWTDDEIAFIRSQGREPFSFAIIPTKINQFLSSQRRNRTSWRVIAKEDPNDEIKAEIATVQLRDVENRSNMKYVESDIYDSGLSIKYGVAKILLDKDRYYNDVVKIKEVDYKNFVWDNNATEYSKGDASFMAEIERIPRYELERRYGVKESAEVSSGTAFSWGREKQNYFITIDNNGNAQNDVVSLITHYHKVNRDAYCVLFNDFLDIAGVGIDGTGGKFKSKKDAEQKLRELGSVYIQNGQLIPEGSVVKETRTYLDKYVFSHVGIHEYEETGLEDFPYSLYFSFSSKNDFWCLTDLLKDPQQWLDRLYMQIDYAFGKDIKNIVEINVNGLAENETPESIVAKIENGEPIFVKSPNAITTVKTDGANPQWQLIAGNMQQLIEDFTGGRSFQGLKESSGESGRAISLKQQQGEMISSLFMDNLFRFKKDLGEKVIWHLRKYDKASRIVRLMGGSMSPEVSQLLEDKGLLQPSQTEQGTAYVRVNGQTREGEDVGLSFLDDSAYELLVSEDILSETAKEKRAQQIMLAEQTNPMLVQLPSWFEIKLSAMDIPFNVRQKILQEMEAQKQQQAQMAQEQMNMQKAEILSKMKDKAEGQGQGQGQGQSLRTD